MSPYRRNFLVGVTVLGGLLVLAWMILKFSGQSARLFAESQISVQFVVNRADGLAEGSPVLYRGVNVGQVTNVRRSDNQRDVIVSAALDERPPLPQNVEGLIRLQALLGAGAGVNLELVGPEPIGQLQPGATIPARYVGLDLIPPEFAGLAADLRRTVRAFQETHLIENLNQTVTQAGKTLQSVEKLVADPETQQDIRQTLGNLRSASESATRIGQKLETISDKIGDISADASTTVKSANSAIQTAEARINELSEQMSARLEQASKLLENFEAISAKVNAGEGTAGMLVNDPKLYESLVDSSRQLSVTIADLKRLIEQWEEEGVTVRLR